MKIVITGFLNTMSKPQRIAGLIYLPFHIIILPLFINMLAEYLPGGLSDTAANAVYYGLGFAFCLICMWKYLRTAFDFLLDNVATNITAMLFGGVSYLLLSYLASGVLFAILGDEQVASNNELISSLADESSRAIVALTVFVAPIVEEVLFRGVVFGTLAPKHRRLAFVSSIALFAFYNVWQLALSTMDLKMFLYMVLSIPMGYALAWVYEKTNCLWVPIFLHMLINILTVGV
ncbi:MAG: CPBP family intramembrane metalloprotease [Oscillospiraceae bacterium]|nr:CPBP family intramembrane metalloprotease [Oscillospiraceae bacterium]